MKKLFVIIGVPRSGTTFIHNHLKKFSSINLLEKENHFFLTKETYINPKNIFNIKRYDKKNIYLHKNKLSEKKINVDINTLYFYDLDSLINIKKIYGENVRFICILRDPLKRFISHTETLIKKIDLSINNQSYFINKNMSNKRIFQEILKDEFIDYSNYSKYIDQININQIQVDYFSYEKIFSNKKNLENFFKIFQLNTKIDLKNKIHSKKKYPIKSFTNKKRIYNLVKFIYVLLKIKYLVSKLNSKNFILTVEKKISRFKEDYENYFFE